MTLTGTLLYKVEHIHDLSEDAVISFYQQGEYVDMCVGPHLCYRHIQPFRRLTLRELFLHPLFAEPLSKHVSRFIGNHLIGATILSSVFANLYTTVNGIFAYGQMTSFVQLSINYLNPPRSPLAEHYAESLHENRAGVPAAEPCR